MKTLQVGTSAGAIPASVLKLETAAALPAAACMHVTGTASAYCEHASNMLWVVCSTTVRWICPTTVSEAVPAVSDAGITAASASSAFMPTHRFPL
jgi:hypothetical protein